MRPLQSKNGLAALTELAKTNAVYAFDFDGTLARITPTPTDAKMLVSTHRLIEKLSALAPVAIVSGRSIADLKLRVLMKGLSFVGNHGLEGTRYSEKKLHAAQKQCSRYLKIFQAQLTISGIEIEEKTFSLAIHYRKAKARALAKSQIEACLKKLSPAPRVIPGKSVYNILPEDTPHKGSAVYHLMKRENVGRAFFIGDDDTDEDVFRLEDSRICSVRVGFKKTSLAQFYLKSQSEVNQLLKILIHNLQAPAASPGRLALKRK